MNDRLDDILKYAKARSSGAAGFKENRVIGECDKCGKEITDMCDLGYMGAADRGSEECYPTMAFETLCAECEGSSVCD